MGGGDLRKKKPLCVPIFQFYRNGFFQALPSGALGLPRSRLSDKSVIISFESGFYGYNHPAMCLTYMYVLLKTYSCT